MANPDKVDLKEVNKKKKTLKFPTISNPFKKQKGPKRDEVGKFTNTVGTGGLARAKDINIKRALPVVVLVALVGGFFVFQSFAANANGAFVTEMYQRCYNQMIGSGSGYDFWLKKLDSGTSRNSVWASFVAASGKPCNNPYPPASANSTPAPAGTSNGTASMTAQQITALYQEILGRAPSQGDIDYWVNKSKTTTPSQVRAFIENTEEAFRRNIEKKLVEAKAWKDLSAAHVLNAKTYNSETYKISMQSVVTKENLSTIATKEKGIRTAIGQVSSGLGTVKASYDKAVSNKLSQANSFKTVVDSMTANNQSLNAYLKNITADYNRAEKKYEANIKFFQQVADRRRQEEDCRNRGGTPSWTGGCNMPATNQNTYPVNNAPSSPSQPSSTPGTSSSQPSGQSQGSVNCSAWPERKETRIIDGGRTTQERTQRWVNFTKTECGKQYTPWRTVSTNQPRPSSCPVIEYATRTTIKYWPNVFGTKVYQLKTRYNRWEGDKSRCTRGSWSSWRDVSRSTHDQYN